MGDQHLGSAVLEHEAYLIGLAVPVLRHRRRADEARGEGGFKERIVVAQQQRHCVTRTNADGPQGGRGAQTALVERVGRHELIPPQDSWLLDHARLSRRRLDWAQFIRRPRRASLAYQRRSLWAFRRALQY